MIFILAWAVTAAAALFYNAVHARERHIETGEKLAWRQGVFPASRGRILDKNGKTLAWSERFFDLYLEKEPEGQARRNALRAELKTVLGGYYEESQGGMAPIKKALPPETVSALSGLLSTYPELKLMSRVERRCIDYPEVREYIGRAETRDGVMAGVSGAELALDKQLRGENGSYVVMLDKNNHWVSGTWKLGRDARNGLDITVDKSLEEIIAEARKDK
jgi:cell division protein FtsI/penicillin-binding protein 2